MSEAKVSERTIQAAREYLVESETSITRRMLALHLQLSDDSALRCLRILAHLGEIESVKSHPGGHCEVVYHVKGRNTILPAHLETDRAHAAAKLRNPRRRLLNPHQKTVKRWAPQDVVQDDITAALFPKRRAA